MSHLAVSPFIGPEQPRTVSGWPQNKTDMKIAFAALLWTQLLVSGRGEVQGNDREEIIACITVGHKGNAQSGQPSGVFGEP